MATITWLTANGAATTAEVAAGMNLMDAAIANGITPIKGECGGCLSCATCHVFVDPAWVEQVGAADYLEETMLDMTAVERRQNSRLSCQIIAAETLDGLILHVPEPET